MLKMWWAIGCVLMSAGCLRTTSFHCSHNDDCDTAGHNGKCEDVGFCSFADSNCPDGRRFGDLADRYANTCVGELPGIDAAIHPDAAPVSIGGTVTGLTGTGLVLEDNGGDNRTIAASGPFTFATKLPPGSPYTVTIGTPPSGQDAYVGHASGTVGGGGVNSVLVSCFAAGSDPGIRCDTGIFCTGSTQECCIDKTSLAGTCQGTGSFCSKAAMKCDSSNECSAGSVCCAQFHSGTSGFQGASCVGSVSQCSSSGGGNSAELLCDSRDATPCPSPMACTGTSMLGSAYHTCQ